MKTKEELYHKANQSPRLLRVFLKPNSQSGQLYQPDKEQENPVTTQSVSWKLRGNPQRQTLTIESQAYLILQSNNKTRIAEKTVKRLIQQFREAPEQGVFSCRDLNKTEKINTFREQSKKLITDMGNTEIFELCETSSKKQCPDCALYWEIGIVYCS